MNNWVKINFFMSEIYKQKTYFILNDDECVKKFNKDARLILLLF